MVASRNSSLGHQRPQEAGVGGQPEDGGLVERVDQRPAGRLAVGAVRDHLAEHRVVRRAHDLAALQRVVDPRRRSRPPHDRARCRPAAGSRRTSPRRRPAPRSRARSSVTSSCVIGSGSPAATQQLQLDEVEPRHQLGDRVLDLEAGVHLQEVGLAGVGVEQELHGAGVDVVRPRGASATAAFGDAAPAWRRRWSGPAPPPAPSGGGAGWSSRARRGAARCRGRRRSPAPRCGGRARRTSRPGSCRRRTPTAPRAWRRRRPRRSPRRADDAHALAAATGRGLDQDVRGSRRRPRPSRHDRHAGRHGDLAGGVLAAHLLHHARRRGRPADAGGLDRARRTPRARRGSRSRGGRRRRRSRAAATTASMSR